MVVVEHTAGETRRERRLLVEEAGYSKVSFISVLAGFLVAYGAFALFAALVGGIVRAFGVETDVGNYDWETVGGVGTAIIGVALFLAYLFGGYVAGRMAFRSAVTHGFLVFVLGIIVAGLVGLFVGAITGTEAIEENLRNVGVPTTADEWGAVGTIAGIVSLVAMLGGAILGAVWGERWYGKLLRRAASDNFGPDAVDRPTSPATTPEPTEVHEPSHATTYVHTPSDTTTEVRAPADVDRPTTVREPDSQST